MRGFDAGSGSKTTTTTTTRETWLSDQKARINDGPLHTSFAFLPVFHLAPKQVSTRISAAALLPFRHSLSKRNSSARYLWVDPAGTKKEQTSEESGSEECKSLALGKASLGSCVCVWGRVFLSTFIRWRPRAEPWRPPRWIWAGSAEGIAWGKKNKERKKKTQWCIRWETSRGNFTQYTWFCSPFNGINVTTQIKHSGLKEGLRGGFRSTQWKWNKWKRGKET